jgi:uncharacterized membrane protein
MSLVQPTTAELMSSTRAAGWRAGVLVVLAALGVAVSAYLTWVHYGGLPLLCGEGGGCETVQGSRFAMLGDVPVALLGLGLYVGLLILAGWWWRAGRVVPTLVPLALFGLALAGTLYSLYLTYLELFVIRAICPWCITSAALITTILVLTIRDLLQFPGEVLVHGE